MLSIQTVTKLAKLRSMVISGLVILCLLGMQFLGTVHQLSHAPNFKTSISSATAQDQNFSFGHITSSNECKLFDGLALSSAVASGLMAFVLLNHYSHQYVEFKRYVALQTLSTQYLSRAPPQI